MGIAYIMRGVPGSGKSTRARELAGSTGIVHSSDDYFFVDGKYHFDAARLQEFHDRNFAAFCLSLRRGIPIVIADNTNAKIAYFQRYIEAARQAGYQVTIVPMPHLTAAEASRRTIHAVPVEVIQRMLDEWEDFG